MRPMILGTGMMRLALAEVVMAGLRSPLAVFGATTFLAELLPFLLIVSLV